MTWDYIAGFFDGEGSLVHNGEGFRILIPQTHEGVLLVIKNSKNNLIVKKITVLNAIPRLTITLNGMVKRKKIRIDRKNTVEKLRAKGLTYREIGKKVGIDFGYARRLLIK